MQDQSIAPTFLSAVLTQWIPTHVAGGGVDLKGAFEPIRAYSDPEFPGFYAATVYAVAWFRRGSDDLPYTFELRPSFTVRDIDKTNVEPTTGYLTIENLLQAPLAFCTFSLDGAEAEGIAEFSLVFNGIEVARLPIEILCIDV